MAAACKALDEATRRLGCTLTGPLMTLSSLALPVISSPKLTDRALVDVDAFSFVDVW